MSRAPARIAVIGGGSSYTPEIVEGLLNRRDDLPLRELWLTDIPEGEQKLAVVTALARRMVRKVGQPFAIRSTMRREEALDGADFVVSQFRVGLLEARLRDERRALRHGAIGQETVGAGGFAKALRTIPVALDICRDMQRLCPDAFLINFTNPSGVVTEALLKHSRIKVIGLCNNPINMERWVADRFGVTRDRVSIEFVGCNHLVWGNRVFVDGRDVTVQALETLSADASNVTTAAAPPWPRALLLSLGALPNPYHKYYYLHDQMLAALLADAKAGRPTRAEIVKGVEAALFTRYGDPTLDVKPPELALRGGALYSEAAVRLMDAIYNDRNDVQCVDSANRGALSDLPDDAVVEVCATIGAGGAKPVSVGRLRPQLLGLLQTIKRVEALTVQAAVFGDRDAALQALQENPLVPAGAAGGILADLLEEDAAYLPQFPRSGA